MVKIDSDRFSNDTLFQNDYLTTEKNYLILAFLQFYFIEIV